MMKIIYYIASGILGAGLGYLIYKYIGCRSGSCPITSNPYYSMIWGVLFGITMMSSFIDKLVK
ncbi:MAG TPA: DUF6132 family protein [Candidatus Cloacimonadota bacterium]|nr:DUF6132 family protein [Candidatus Cloacimonadota bacterium]